MKINLIIYIAIGVFMVGCRKNEKSQNSIVETTEEEQIDIIEDEPVENENLTEDIIETDYQYDNEYNDSSSEYYDGNGENTQDFQEQDYNEGVISEETIETLEEYFENKSSID